MDATLDRQTSRTITAVVTVATLLGGGGYVVGLYFLSRYWSPQARTKAFTLNKWPRRLVPGRCSHSLQCRRSIHYCGSLSHLSDAL